MFGFFIKKSRCPSFWICGGNLGFNGFASSPLPSRSPSSPACPILTPPLAPPAPQLNLIHSEVSNLAGFDVEGVINPTNAELELKDDLGELPPSPNPQPHTLSGPRRGSVLKILESPKLHSCEILRELKNNSQNNISRPVHWFEETLSSRFLHSHCGQLGCWSSQLCQWKRYSWNQRYLTFSNSLGLYEFILTS